jgi:hypothetical protein
MDVIAPLTMRARQMGAGVGASVVRSELAILTERVAVCLADGDHALLDGRDEALAWFTVEEGDSLALGSLVGSGKVRAAATTAVVIMG